MTGPQTGIFLTACWFRLQTTGYAYWNAVPIGGWLVTWTTSASPCRWPFLPPGGRLQPIPFGAKLKDQRADLYSRIAPEKSAPTTPLRSARDRLEPFRPLPARSLTSDSSSMCTYANLMDVSGILRLCAKTKSFWWPPILLPS